MSQLSVALACLAKARERSDSVVVAYSGGKDSLVTMDMCVRNFRRVEAYMMEFVPGLGMNEERKEFARARWGVTVTRWPEPGAMWALANGVYCTPTRRDTQAEPLTVNELQRMVRLHYGIPLIATGHKRSDSIGRRKEMQQRFTDDLVTPLADFRKADVLSYLKAKGIPLPDDEGRNSNAIGLGIRFLLWCHDNRPEDFKKLGRIYPYIDTVIERRRIYGDDSRAGKRLRDGKQGDEIVIPVAAISNKPKSAKRRGKRATKSELAEEPLVL